MSSANIRYDVAGDGLTVRLPLVVGFARALELITLEERLRIEAEMVLSMFLRQDRHSHGAGSFVAKTPPEWKHHGL
mgnify:CR=1 FL=1